MLQRLLTRWPLLVALISIEACAAVPPAPAAEAGIFVDLPLKRVADVAHPPLNELSGLLGSERFPGTFWAVNDSGAPPRLFALGEDFRVRVPEGFRDRYAHGGEEDRATWPGIDVTGARLVDWESLARIGDRLYLADTGNNASDRRDLGLWEIQEPDPDTTVKAPAIRYLRVHYPEQEAFPGAIREWDCEAVFADDGKLYLITKHRNDYGGALTPGARLYRFDPTTAGESSTPLELISRHDRVLAATGADLSPDGELLALLTYSALWLFPRPSPGDDWFSGTPFIRPLPILRTRQAEAVSWHGDDALLITNEPGGVFRVEVDRAHLDAARPTP